VRRASSRLAHRGTAVIDVVTALADVEDTALVDIEVPILSSRRSVRAVKLGVRKLVAWYLRYLTQQVTAFHAAVSRFGAVLVERTDQIEESTATLARDLHDLAQRVERLEEGVPNRATAGAEPEGTAETVHGAPAGGDGAPPA
jgi:hypothetical protein